jgi:beta-N-acetylhexosaminidase
MKRWIAVLLLPVLLLFLLPSCSSLQKDKITTDVTVDKSESEVASSGTSLSAEDSTQASETQIETTNVSAAEDRARELLSAMTLEEKVGQMFFASWVQGDVNESIKKWKFGGIILFAPDFENRTPSEVTQIIASYQEVTTLPLLIGVDEEGGSVVRISKFSQFRDERFLSPQELFKQGGWDLIQTDTTQKSQLLQSLGINVNLAPVCDVSTDPDDFIYGRSFGSGAEETSDYITTVVEEMVLQNIGCSLKHFPGYGNNVDTHTGIALDNRSYESFEESDFLPFIAGIRAGAGSVMVSHNVVSCMDAVFPASLSPEVHRVLREELGFSGVIMTDDLSMDAISLYTGDEDAAVLAVLAGNDMIIGSAFEEQIPAVILAVQNEDIPIDVIDAAVLRILLWKIELGIVE